METHDPFVAPSQPGEIASPAPSEPVQGPGSLGGPSMGEVCKFFQRGDCKFGDTCRKAHIIKGDDSQAGQRGRRSFQSRRNRPGSKPCRFFVNGSCKYGSSCKFEHTKERPRPARDNQRARNDGFASPAGAQASGSPKGQDLCRFFLQGSCKYGSACRFNHPDAGEIPLSSLNDVAAGFGVYPTFGQPQFCRFFMQGQCKYGSSCRFVHPAMSPSTKEGAGDPVAANPDMDQEMMMYAQQFAEQQHYAAQQYAAYMATQAPEEPVSGYYDENGRIMMDPQAALYHQQQQQQILQQHYQALAAAADPQGRPIPMNNPPVVVAGEAQETATTTTE